MTNDYGSLIQTNPIVPFSQSPTGWRMSKWCNYEVVMNASTKTFHIKVFSNTADEAMFYANQLKTYIEANPIVVNSIPDDISIGLQFPIYDQISRGYYVTLIMMVGNLRVPMGGKEDPCPLTPSAYRVPKENLTPCG